MRIRMDGLTIVAIVLIFFMLGNVLHDGGVVEAAPIEKVNAAALSVVPMAMGGEGKQTGAGLAAEGSVDTTSVVNTQEPDPDAIIPPYDQYELTQGLHGLNYGQLAIDIAAGKGATIKSPVNGQVTALYVDEWGNPTLIIDNGHYQVMMLHGIYTVNVGDQVTIGQPVGQEGNLGNTYDAFGQPCWGRDCGYHTHLNIFDKHIGANADPLLLFQK